MAKKDIKCYNTLIRYDFRLIGWNVLICEVYVMLRSVTALILIIVTFAACSKAGNIIAPDQLEGDKDSIITPQADENSGAISENDLDVWGAYEVIWEPTAGSITLSDRNGEVALRHYKVSYFLSPPQCSDCIELLLNENNSDLGTGSFDVTLKNPTVLNGFDVRAVLRIPKGQDLTLLNADGYTDLFEHPDYVSPAPFMTFATYMPSHIFGPNQYYSREFLLKAKPGTTLVTFTILVTAGYPSPPGDVSYVGHYRQNGQLKYGGGTATVSFEILDLQNDIGGVKLHTSPLGGGDIWMTLSGDRWEATIVNPVASPGIHILKVDAYSPNQQNAVTSGYYKAVVFENLDSFRSELLNLINQDRAANGLGSLMLDPLINTAAQYHGQDMADKLFFAHINLDNLSPWDRMAYYGVEFSSAGENIAVGQDSPSQVEQDWMNSSGHRANILGGSFGKVGLGIVSCKPGDKYYPGYYWIQEFTN